MKRLTLNLCITLYPLLTENKQKDFCKKKSARFSSSVIYEKTEKRKMVSQESEER